MGHFGEIRLADPVFSAVVLPTNSAHDASSVWLLLTGYTLA